MRTTAQSGEVIVSILQAESLEAKGLLNDQSSLLQIKGKCFKPGPSFSKRLRQTAIEFCEDAPSQGRQYILIEFPTYLMAWLRIQAQKPTQSSDSATVEVVSSTPPAPKRTSDPQHQLGQTVKPPPTPTLSKEHKPQNQDSEEHKPQNQDSDVNGTFIDQCKAELATHIGPMAHFMTEQTLKKSPQLTRQQLIEALAVHIPDVDTAHAFRDAVQLLLEK